jgi:hypothetical protein
MLSKNDRRLSVLISWDWLLGPSLGSILRTSRFSIGLLGSPEESPLTVLVLWTSLDLLLLSLLKPKYDFPYERLGKFTVDWSGERICVFGIEFLVIITGLLSSKGRLVIRVIVITRGGLGGCGSLLGRVPAQVL